MSKSEEIKKAIGAHGMWKVRLRSAVDTGTSEFTVDKVKADNNCDFGKWLHGLSPDEKKTENWAKVRDLHAKFHVEAAKILENALTGKKDTAAKGLDTSSEFSKLSASLTSAMISWEKA